MTLEESSKRTKHLSIPSSANLRSLGIVVTYFIKNSRTIIGHSSPKIANLMMLTFPSFLQAIPNIFTLSWVSMRRQAKCERKELAKKKLQQLGPEPRPLGQTCQTSIRQPHLESTSCPSTMRRLSSSRWP